jgi:hypothetical protein
VSVNKFELSDATVRPTTGLVPYRLKRPKTDKPSVAAEEAERWASQQPWFPRVKDRRADARFFCWFVVPETPAEFETLRLMHEVRR